MEAVSIALILKEFLTPIILGCLTLLGICIPAYLKYKESKDKAKELKETELAKVAKIQSEVQFSMGIKDMAEVYSYMDKLRRDIPSVNRVMIIKCHNSFKAPKPTGNLYLTALFEEPAKDTTPVLNIVQHLPVDHFHLDHIILPLLMSDTIVFDKETGGGFLKDAYEAFNHEWAKGKALLVQEDCMIYMIIQFRAGTPKELTPLERETIKLVTNNIKNIMEKYRS